ncbi:hypothetical protein BHE74_00048759 [Ensete ventricosum]|nr:hypothetical protein BHE74_00048759 [Ensete ventricosum]
MQTSQAILATPRSRKVTLTPRAIPIAPDPRSDVDISSYQSLEILESNDKTGSRIRVLSSHLHSPSPPSRMASSEKDAALAATPSDAPTM